MSAKDYEMERSLGFLMADVSRLMRKRFDRRAHALGLTRAQWREENDWVERRPDPEDRRVWRLYLTDKAQPVLAEMEKIAVWNRDTAMSDFTPAESERFIDDLLRIKANTIQALREEAEEDADVEQSRAKAAGGRHG